MPPPSSPGRRPPRRPGAPPATPPPSATAVAAARSTTPRRHRGAPDETSSSSGYFFAWQTLVEACQSPPALSQSAWFVIVDSDLPVEAPPDDGLAEGDVDGPVDGVDIEPEPVVPELPGDTGVLLAPAPVVPPPVAPPACAAASARAKTTLP